MANAWVFDSNTGTFKLNEREPDETTEDKEKRTMQLKNMLSGGNAGLGSMFTATEGGVQKTYAQSPGETVGTVENTQKSLPKTVGTGRAQEMSEQERALKESLQGITGTTAGAIADRYTGLQKSLEDASDLGSYKTPGVSATDFSKLLSGETNITDYTNNLKSSAEAEAEAKYNAAINPLQSQYDELSNLLSEKETAFKDTGISNLTTTEVASLSPKAQQAYLSKLSRLRSTGLSSDVRAAQEALESTLTQQAETESTLNTLKNVLGSQKSSYGSEISNLGLSTAKDLNSLKEFINKQANLPREVRSLLVGDRTEDIKKYGEILQNYGFGNIDITNPEFLTTSPELKSLSQAYNMLKRLGKI